MTTAFITLVNDLFEYNMKNNKNKLNLKEYLIQILNYPEDEAEDYYKYYINSMNYN